MDGILNLKGFVLPNTPETIWNFGIFVKSGKNRVTGYFIGKDDVTRFTQDESGEATFAVLSCPVAVDLSTVSGTFYAMSFPYTERPEPAAPHLVLLGFKTAGNAPQALAKAWGGAVRDTVRGTLTKVSRADLLRAGSAAYEAPMTIYEERDDALRAAGRPGFALSDEMLAHAEKITLGGMVPSGDSVLRAEGQGLSGRSNDGAPWSYIGVLDLPAGCLPGGGWLVVDIRAERNEICIGVENKAGGGFLTRRSIRPWDGLQRVNLPLSPDTAVGKFVVQHGSMSGPAEALIGSIRLVKNNGAVTGSCQ